MSLPIFKVLVDTNVLFPLALCDTLLRAADAGLFQIYWSERIVDELEVTLVRELKCSEQGAGGAWRPCASTSQPRWSPGSNTSSPPCATSPETATSPRRPSLQAHR